VKLVPINVTIKKQGTDKAPRDGLVVKRFDTVTIQLSDIPQASFIAKAQDIKWYSRSLKTDGTYEDWSEMDGHPRGVSIDYRCDAVGIYQVKCEWSVGTQQFVTNFERSFDDSNTRDPYKLKKGDPDSFGVTETQWQIDLRDKAKSHLGSREYALNVWNWPIQPGRDKCNIFVANMGAEADVYIPWINSSGIAPFILFPPVADQWFGAPANPPANPEYEDLLGEFWTITADTHPQPGFIVSRGFYSWGTGHCGIVDYDGRWISASSETDTINRQANFSSERGRDLQNHPLLPAMRITTGE